MSQKLVGVITGHRIGPKSQHPKEYILQFLGFKSSNEAARLLGRKVAWSVDQRKIRGKIVALHGKNGLVRARFGKGVPGQAIGTRVEIIG